MSMQQLRPLSTPLLRWAPSIILMAAIFIFSSIPSSGLPDFGWVDLLIKKGGHFLGYSLLAFSYYWALGFDRPYARLWAFLLAGAYAVTDELHQSFVPGRGSWWVDVVIDSSGAAFAMLISPSIRRLFPKL